MADVEPATTGQHAAVALNPDAEVLGCLGAPERDVHVLDKGRATRGTVEQGSEEYLRASRFGSSAAGTEVEQRRLCHFAVDRGRSNISQALRRATPSAAVAITMLIQLSTVEGLGRLTRFVSRSATAGGLEVAVQNERIQVGAVRPHDGVGLRVDGDLGKEVGVLEWFEDRPAITEVGNIDLAYEPVVERHAKPVVAEDVDVSDANHL
jgi:hypothetical protein